MKQYQLVLNVPDDFDPEALNLSSDQNIDVVEEDFVADDTDDIVRSVVDKIQVEKLGEVTKNSVIVFKYPIELMNPDIIVPIQQMIEAKLGCKTIGLLDNIEILTQNSVEAIKMLQSMINKINASAIIKLS